MLLRLNHQLVLWVLVTVVGCPFAVASPNLVRAEFGDVSTRHPGTARAHFKIDTVHPNTAAWSRVFTVRMSGDVVEVVLETIMEGVGGDAITARSIPLTIDHLPEGNVVLHLSEDDSDRVLDEIELEVSTDRPLQPPAAVSIWPPDPTVLDDVWLLVEPMSFCNELEFYGPFVDKGGGIWINELTRPCEQEPVSPRLAAFNLGAIPAETIAKDSDQFELAERREVEYRIDERPQHSQEISRTYVRVPVERRIPSRIAGSWYNPNEAGHGITIDMTGQGELLLYWVTFDLDGNSAWIMAIGEPSGLKATLEAVTVSGGRFPPEFDTEAVATEPWGIIELEFVACDGAQMDWQSSRSGFTSGSMSLERLSRQQAHNCSGPPPDSALVPSWYQGPGTWYVLPHPGIGSE